MKAIVNTKKNVLEMQELPMPEPGPGQVRIRTKACCICATDLEMIAGWKRNDFGTIPGHEWSGVVDSVGDTVDTCIVSKNCVGANIMPDGGEIGFEHPGGYGQYFVAQAANLHVLPDDFPMHAAALIEPLAVSIRLLRRLGDDIKEPILLFGDGPIGMQLVQILRQQGKTDITLIGGREQRLEKAKDLGAVRTLNYHDLGDDLGHGLLENGVKDVASMIEVSGSSAAITACVKVARHDARIVLIGGNYANIKEDSIWHQIMVNELSVIGSNASAGAWPEAVRLAISGEIELEKIISHRLDAQDFEEAIELMRSHRGDVTKVVLEWN